MGRVITTVLTSQSAPMEPSDKGPDDSNDVVDEPVVDDGSKPTDATANDEQYGQGDRSRRWFSGTW